LLLVKKAPHATHRSFHRRRYHSCWVLRREMQGCSIGTTVASKGLTYRSLRRVSDIEHWRSKEEQHEAQMGPIMSGCGALLGAHVCNGSSGSAPSSSPWRFSIRTRTFAEVTWRREVLCAGASAEIARRGEELRAGSPDAVGGMRGCCAADARQASSRTRSGSVEVSQSRDSCRTMVDLDRWSPWLKRSDLSWFGAWRSSPSSSHTP